MKIKLYMILAIILLVLKSDLFSSQCSQGIKLGLNYSKFRCKNEGLCTPINGYPMISYSKGYIAGIFNETIISDEISLINEVCIRNNKLVRTIYTGTEDIVNQKIHLNYLSLPLLVKIKMKRTYLPYFLLGLDIGFVFKANYKFTSRFYYKPEEIEITNLLPLVDTSLNIGIGKRFEILRYFLIFEGRYLFGLTEYAFDKFAPRYPGSWRYSRFQLLIGMQFSQIILMNWRTICTKK